MLFFTKNKWKVLFFVFKTKCLNLNLTNDSIQFEIKKKKRKEKIKKKWFQVQWITLTRTSQLNSKTLIKKKYAKAINAIIMNIVLHIFFLYAINQSKSHILPYKRFGFFIIKSQHKNHIKKCALFTPKTRNKLFTGHQTIF